MAGWMSRIRHRDPPTSATSTSPHLRNENQFEVDPIRIDPIINIVVRLNPIAIHIARGSGFSVQKHPVDEYLLNTSQPKCFDGGLQALSRANAVAE